MAAPSKHSVCIEKLNIMLELVAKHCCWSEVGWRYFVYNGGSLVCIADFMVGLLRGNKFMGIEDFHGCFRLVDRDELLLHAVKVAPFFPEMSDMQRIWGNCQPVLLSFFSSHVSSSMWRDDCTCPMFLHNKMNQRWIRDKPDFPTNTRPLPLRVHHLDFLDQKLGSCLDVSKKWCD